MGSMLRFWQFLEHQPGRALTQSEWTQLTGPGLPAVQPLLVATGSLATRVPSPMRNAPDLRVVYHNDSTLVGVCDEQLTSPVSLCAEDLVLFRLDLQALRRTVCGSLGLRLSASRILSLPGAITLGHWQPQLQTTFPVILVAHPVARDLRSLAREAVLTSDRPALILTSTDEGWDDSLLGFMEQHRCAMGVLDDLLDWDATGTWSRTQTWDVVTEAFAARAGFVPGSAFQNRKRRAKRGDRLANIESVRAAINALGRERALQVDAARKAKQTLKLPKPLKRDIARKANLTPSQLSNCLGDDQAQDLAPMIHDLNDQDGLLQRWGPRRSARKIAD